MIKVAVLGATGYSALELIKILLRHPSVEIAVATSRQEGSPHLASIHPSLAGRVDLRCADLGPIAVASRAECVFGCLPHGVTADVVPHLLSAGARVIDLSADYRLRDPAVFSDWYGEPHRDPARLADAVYGLPELFRDRIREARLVANPGCYPTSAAVALAPLVARDLIDREDIIVDSKSGVSGAGRQPKLTTLFPECNESVSAYNVGRHRHTPEIEQTLTDCAGKPVRIIFTPHLIPMDRGILTTTYSRPTRSIDEPELLSLYREFYAREPFVRVVDHLPATKDASGTNYCDVTVRRVRDRIITVSCLDNLIKGAAGQAVQNFNLMYGFPETTALIV